MKELEKVFEQIDREELTLFLQQAVRLPSYIGIEDPEKEMARLISEKLREEGIETELAIVKGKSPNVIAVIRGSGGGKSLAFNGHMDTVPPLGMEDPCSGRIEGDTLYGRGASDMKSGLAAMIFAMIAIKRSGLVPKGDIILSAVTNEEYGSDGAKHYAANYELPDYGVCAEPTGMKLAASQKGLHWFDFTIPGKSVHSGAAETGINAIDRLNELISCLNTTLKPVLEKRIHPLLGASKMNYGKVWGGDQPNVVPGEAHLQLERRFLPGETIDTVRAELDEVVRLCNRGYAPEYAIRYESMPYSIETPKTAMEVPADHPVVLGMLSAAKEVLGKEPELFGIPFWGDAGILYDAGVSCILFGPGNVEDAHSPEEKVSLENVYLAAKIFAALPYMIN